MSRYTFKVGDRVRVIRSNYGNVGRLGTVTTELTTAHTLDDGDIFLGHGIHLDGDADTCGCPSSWLEPYRDDNNEPAESVEAWIADLCERKEVSRV